LVVTVHLHTTLQRRTQDGFLRRLEMTLPPTSTLADVLQRLDIQPGGDFVLFVVNGRTGKSTQPLAEGDEIHLIPAISGGTPVG
jgi:sulfur carrier protein ThiS